jgi:cell division initiation protein
MDVTPIDVRRQQFRTAFRGFDKMEVTSFLVMVADHYEQALRETHRVRQEIVRLEAVVSEHREHEQGLKHTLLAAQQLADGIKTTAEQEAERLIRDAQNRSALLLDQTQARVDEVRREITVLKLMRRDVETTIESSIQTLQNALEYVREQDAGEREEKILLLHRARTADPVPLPQTTGADSRAVGT